VKTASEEINTKISVLPSLTRLRNSNDLAWSTLKDHKITNSDEVAWNGDSIAWNTTSGLDVSDRLDPATADSGWTILLGDDRLLLIVVGEWVEDSVGSTLDTSSEAVVFTVVVVVTHLASWFFLDFDFSYCVFFDDNVVSDWSATFVFYVVVGLDFAAVLSLSDVDLCLVWTFKNNFGLAFVVVASLLCGCGNVNVNSSFWSVFRRCLISTWRISRVQPRRDLEIYLSRVRSTSANLFACLSVTCRSVYCRSRN